MRRRAGKPDARPSRDQGESAFTSILGTLVASIPGARAAELVDFQGETVDYAGRGVPFDLRVAAAHWRIVLDQTEAQGSLRGARWIAARFTRNSYLVYALPERYALVVELARAAALAGWNRAIAACVRALSEEANWHRVGLSDPPWFSVDVASDASGRPLSIRIAGRARPVEILGTIVSPPGAARSAGHGDRLRRERGWRVRFDTGAEATLIREPGGFWYVDVAMDQAAVAQEARLQKMRCQKMR